MIARTYHRITAIDDKDNGAQYDSNDDVAERITAVAEGDANTISSRMVEQPAFEGIPEMEDEMVMHAPVLDIDFPACLIPSSTPGHFHLYLDKPVPWLTYRTLLEALAEAGLIEEGYMRASIDRGATYVRKPTCTKPVPSPVIKPTEEVQF